MIDGIHVVKSPRRGKPPTWYVYAWRGGPRIRRQEGWERPRLNADDVKRLNAELSKVETVEQNTLKSLIRQWRPDSPEWKRLAASTKKTWGAALDRIEEKWGDTTLTVWNDHRMKRKVVQWRDSRSEKPRAADIGVTVLSRLLDFGCLHALIERNVATGIPQLYQNGARADIIWTDEDLETFAAEARRMNRTAALDGVRLAVLTGLRREDLITLSWDEIGDSAIVKKAAKKSRGKRRTVTIPRLPALDELLEELQGRHRQEGVETVLVNSRGKPWTGDGFSHSFSEVRDSVGIFHVDENGCKRAKHIHDLRGTFATKLILQGLADSEVADVMGWSPDQVRGIRRVYVDQGRVSVAIGERLRAGV